MGFFLAGVGCLQIFVSMFVGPRLIVKFGAPLILILACLMLSVGIEFPHVEVHKDVWIPAVQPSSTVRSYIL